MRPAVPRSRLCGLPDQAPLLQSATLPPAIAQLPRLQSVSPPYCRRWPAGSGSTPHAPAMLDDKLAATISGSSALYAM